jgi:hypothetical protein
LRSAREKISDLKSFVADPASPRVIALAVELEEHVAGLGLARGRWRPAGFPEGFVAHDTLV